MASDGCVTKYVWQKINDSINDTVNQIMLDELIRESKSINPAPNRICYKIKHKYPKTTSKRAVELFEEILEQLLHLERKEIPIGEIWGGQ